MSHKCPQCGKEYARPDYLRRHELNHSQPSSRCPLCDREFARADVLRRHLLRSCEARRADAGHSEPDDGHGSSSEAFDVDSIVPRKRRLKGKAQQDTAEASDVHDTSMVFGPVSPISIPAPHDTPAQNSPVVEANLLPTTSFHDAAFGSEAGPSQWVSLQAGSEDAGISGALNAPDVSLEGINSDPFLSWLSFLNVGPDGSALASPTNSHSDHHTVVPTPRLTSSSVLPATGSSTPVLGASAGASQQGTIRIPPLNHTESNPAQPFRAWRHPSGNAAIHEFATRWQGSSETPPAARPLVTTETRQAMLDLFEADLRDQLDCNVFSLGQMSLYLELFFIHFAPLYPIIHRPSLPYRHVSPELLLTMICIGTAFSDKQAGFAIATKIHKRLRNKILERVEDDPHVDVPGLQIILLINLFSRTFCSLKEHHVAQIFHSPSINMSRLSGVFLPKHGSPPAMREVTMSAWLDWVAEEERRRIGWFAFTMDVENGALYRHVILIHCFKIETELPVPPAIWEATSPQIWIEAWRHSPRVPSFRTALRSLAGAGTVAPGLHEDCLWILVHALISVSYTLYFRDLGALSMVHDSKITEWKTHLSTAFNVWVSHVQALQLQNAAASKDGRDNPVHWVGTCFSHLGQILLYTDTEQIRIFAGASNVAGRTISPGEWASANMYCSTWAKSQDGAIACHSAVQLLRSAYAWSEGSRYRSAPNVFPWGMYIASLTIWAYSTVLDGADSLLRPYITRSEQPTSQTLGVEIESSVARRDALQYVEGMASCSHPFQLFEYKDKKQCAGIIAYTAHLVGLLGRGVTNECAKDLIGLLTEHMT